MEGRVASEPMTGVDRAWLEMDEPRNPMVVSGVIEFEGVQDLRKLAATIVERLLQYPRFHQRVRHHGGNYRWVTCESLHLDYHVRLRKLPGVDVESELRQAIATELGEELDRSLPLWRMTFYPKGRQRAAVLFRAHHAVADGIALMKVLLTLADGAATPAAQGEVTASNHEHRHGPLSGLIHRLEVANTALGRIGDTVSEEVRHPGEALRQLRSGQQVVSAVLHLLRLPEDNPERFRAHLSGQRTVAWDCSRPLDPVKQFAREHSIKINDVFLAALCGAFRSYLLEHGGRAEELRNLRVSIPVNLRADDDDSLGNHFGLVMLDLPIGVEAAGDRLALISERMATLKHSPEARTMLACLAAAGHMPAAVEKNLVNFLAAKTVTVVSNLPGPREAMKITGARLSRMVFWPPQTGGVGIGISLLSYAGRITVGVSADRQLIADPQRLIDAFSVELDRLLGRRTGRRKNTNRDAAGSPGRRKPRTRAQSSPETAAASQED